MKRIILLLALPLTLSAQTPVLKAHGPATGTYDTTGANFIGICEVAGSPTTPTDNKSNTYSLLASHVQGGGFASTFVYGAFGPAVGTGHTFSVTQAGTMISFSNVTSGPDKSVHGVADANPNVAGPVTPTNINEIIWTCAALFGTSTSILSGGLTQLDRANSTNWTVDDGYLLPGAGGPSPVSTSWSLSATSTLVTLFSRANPGPLTVTTISPLPELVAGVGGSIPLTANGGSPPYTWTLNAGSLPSGCSISGQAIVCTSGITASITTGLQVKATDSAAVTALSPSLTLPIAAAAISLGSSGFASTGTQYIASAGGTLTATGGITPYTYGYTQGSGPRDTSPYAAIPAGLTLNASTGVVTGTNYGQGYHTTQYLVTDAYGATATTLVTVQIAGVNGWMANVFPADSIFHLKVTTLPLAPAGLSDISTYAAASPRILFGQAPNNTGLPNGIPIIHVPSGQANATVTTVGGGLFTFSTGPLPPYMPVEGTSNNSNPNCCYPGDGHGSVTILDGSGNPLGLYEVWQGLLSGGTWFDASNASWTNVQSTGSNAYAMLPAQHGAPNLAGLPVGPLLLNADEVIGTGSPTTPNGVVRHPTYATINNVLAFHVSPAVASAGAGIGGCTGNPYTDPTTSNLLNQDTPPTSCTTIPIPGMTYRLKAGVPNPGCAATSPQSAIIFQGWRDYGIMFADIGSFFAIVGTPDSRWVDADLACLTTLPLGDFEAVNTQSVMVLWPGNDPTHGYLGSTQVTGGTPSTIPVVTGPAGVTGSVIIQ